ncbi:exodeoxyribonuclease VII large subunit [Dokdonella sp.]|uniref:exodeoxyribonuclease VII large subunit n=1 Tax=Dokdonella sp. TaxID=2291710 RepID=UPI0031C0D2F9|nr:exodeoxyribonuclease VII large subunit [Dokdonella sp.]
MSTLPPVPERDVYTPSTLARCVRELLEGALPQVWVEGELSNLARPASGHLYFTLKDAGAQLRCAMFRPKSTWLRFRPGDGMRVLARGRVSLYEPRGDFQLIVEHLEEAGEGALQRAFEELKARLAAEGLFDATRKRPLPAMPRRIGVITSASGAALRDVLSVLGRRLPLVTVEVLPVPVQGKEAPTAIAAMLQAASRAGRHDVLLLTRGGGSLEDLWAFNDEHVARAIAASTVPVVCAVGHETDFTIADFTADLRAPTPSAAAELLVPDAQELARRLAQARRRSTQLLMRGIDVRAQHLDHLLARLGAQRPALRLANAGERLQALQQRLARHAWHALDRRRLALAGLDSRLRARHPAALLRARDERLAALHARLLTGMQGGLQHRQERANGLARALHAVSPLATLERGYAIVFDAATGRVLRSIAQVVPGQALRARLADGEIDALATATRRVGKLPPPSS